MSFFKKDKKETLEASRKLKLFKNAHDLGFEVGYHKHSELGWVVEAYLTLEEFSREYGLEESVKEQYSKGKEEGFQSRKKDSHEGLFREDAGVEKEISSHSMTILNEYRREDLVSESGFSRDASERVYAPIGRPAMMNIPEMVSLADNIRMPSQIKGFRPLMPKK